MADAANTVPTVGYDKRGRPRPFDLKPGAKLPNGWADRPPKGTHPAEIADGLNAEPEARRRRPRIRAS
jgi:hypothetical protein